MINKRFIGGIIIISALFALGSICANWALPYLSREQVMSVLKWCGGAAGTLQGLTLVGVRMLEDISTTGALNGWARLRFKNRLERRESILYMRMWLGFLSSVILFGIGFFINATESEVLYHNFSVSGFTLCFFVVFLSALNLAEFAIISRIRRKMKWAENEESKKSEAIQALKGSL